LMMKVSLLLLQLAAGAVAYSPLSPVQQTRASVSSSGETSRRNLLASVALIGTSALTIDPSKAFAAAAADTSSTNLVDFKDAARKVSIKVPSDWDATVQELPDRRKINLYIKPNSDQKTLMFFAYTPVRDDYTSLGSFGTVDQVAQFTILPKGEVGGAEGVTSVMLSSESKKSAYFFDYKQTVPVQPETHFRTIFSLVPGATGGAGSILVSITVQCPESEYATMKPMFDAIISSYGV
jgi:hypothetical protein